MQNILIIIFILLYSVIAVRAYNKVVKSYCCSKFSKLIIVLFSPFILAILLVFGVFLIPFCFFSILYYWLYPESHTNEIDFAGSKEQQQVLQEYRLRLKKKTIFRRLFEKLLILHSNEPSLNEILNQIGTPEGNNKEI